MKKLFLLFLSSIFVIAACNQGSGTPIGMLPIIKDDLSEEPIEHDQSESLALSVTAHSPNGKGVISYEWFKVEEKENALWLSERSISELAINTNELGTFEFFCRVYHKERGKTTVYRDSIHQKIIIKENNRNISNDAALTPYIAPIQQKTAWKGKEFSLKVEAEAKTSGTLSYQWYEVENPQGANPRPVNGETANTLTITKTLPKTYYYYCRVKNSRNGSTAMAVSNIVSVEVKKEAPAHAQKPQITVKNSNCIVKSSEQVKVSVEAAVTDGGSLSYQWYIATGTEPANGDTKVPDAQGGNTDSITVTESTAATKKYYCKVTNTLTIDSDTTKTEEAVCPLITIEWKTSAPDVREPAITHPTADIEKTVRIGTVFWMDVAAHSVDNGKLSYQWYWNTTKDTGNGRKIADATQNRYAARIDNIETRYYYCEVTNKKGTGTPSSKKRYSGFYCYTTHSEKKPAQKPKITQNWPDNPPPVVKGREPRVIKVTAQSPDGGSLTYQWYRSAAGNMHDAEYLTGETNDTLTIPTDKTGIFYFSCLVTNTNTNAKEGYTIQTAYSKWYKADIKHITDFSDVAVQPVGITSATIEKNTTATFKVAVLYAPDGATFAYQWKKGEPPAAGTNPPADSNAEGTNNTESYTTSTSLVHGHSYSYYCVVTVTKSGLEQKTVCSPKFTLTVVDVLPKAPEITTQPTGGVNVKTTGVPLTVAATAKGGEPKYQWYKHTVNVAAGGAEIASATSATYKAEDEGTFYYYCEVSNSNDSTKKTVSNPVWVTVYRDAAYTPVDMNSDATDGFGWNTQNWALGSKKSGNEITFAVYSEHAESMMLEIYGDESGSLKEKAAFFMEKGTDHIWRAKIQTTAAKVYYGYRAWGPNWKRVPKWVRGSEHGFVSETDSSGNQFNPNKLLIDPYALELSHTRKNNASSYQIDDANRNANNGADAPKSLVVDKISNTGIQQKSTQAAFAGEVVYQLHIQGFTGNGVNNIETCTVPNDEKGTYDGAAKMVNYLKNLGVNTVLLMPVFESAGYEDYYPANFFAVAKKYAKDKDNAAKEFQDMVKAFHQAEMQVFLDMPYNQMGESSALGAVRLESLRGLDNRTYYGASGSGSAETKLNAGNEQVKKLITASLDYWLDIMGIDGIRYTPCKNDEVLRAAIIEKLKTKQRKCIIETADAPKNGEVWLAWNNGFRDAVRKAINWKMGAKNETLLKEMVQKGSAVNFAASHTGYRITDTLSHSDVVSEISADAGEWHDSRTLLRRIRYRGLLVLTAFSKGVPMITYGDEFGASQGQTTSVYDTSSNNGVFSNDYGYIGRDNICTELGADKCIDSQNGIYLFAKQLFNLRKTDADMFAHAHYSFTDFAGGNLTDDALQCRILITDKNNAEKYCIYVNMKDESNIGLPMMSGKWTCIIDTDHEYEKQSGGLGVTNNIKTDNTTVYNSNQHKLNKYSIAVFKKIP
ncbi:MAG: alpha-amylase family glycosyl hydrolase [Treponema sp.]